MSLTDEQKARLAEYRTAFSFEDRDRDIAADKYRDGRYVNQHMRIGQRSIKHRKHWQDSQQERSVLRYTIG